MKSSIETKLTTRKVNDIGKKCEILAWHIENGSSQLATAAHFKVAQSSVSRWIKDADQLAQSLTLNGPQVKRQRSAKHPDLEQAVYTWIIEAHARNMVVTGDIIQQKAQDFGKILKVDMSVSDGWLSRFKTRYNIKTRILHGEAASVNTESIGAAREELQKLTGKFSLCDIYNADETGLTYK